MNRRVIEIDKFGKFEVWGSSPWMLFPTKDIPHLPDDAYMITDASLDAIKLLGAKTNCLYRLSNKGARFPVIFKTLNGYEIGNEILSIINKRL